MRCSASAWLMRPDQGGNIEIALVDDSVQARAFKGVLEMFKSPSLKPEEVLLVSLPTATQSMTECPYELAGLRWDASAPRIMAIITSQPETGTAPRGQPEWC